MWPDGRERGRDGRSRPNLQRRLPSLPWRGEMTTTTKIAALIGIFAVASSAAPACPSTSEPKTALCLHKRAMSLMDEGKMSEAEGAYRRAIQIWSDAGPAYNPHRGATLAQLASVYQ